MPPNINESSSSSEEVREDGGGAREGVAAAAAGAQAAQRARRAPTESQRGAAEARARRLAELDENPRFFERILVPTKTEDGGGHRRAMAAADTSAAGARPDAFMRYSNDAARMRAILGMDGEDDSVDDGAAEQDANDGAMDMRMEVEQEIMNENRGQGAAQGEEPNEMDDDDATERKSECCRDRFCAAIFHFKWPGEQWRHLVS